jgi:hypothetical protein
MSPEDVPAELVEKAAEEIAGSWDGNYVFMPTAREMARAALAAVMPEIQAQALRDAADDVSAAPHWPDEDRYTMGWEDAVAGVRTRASRLRGEDGEGARDV